MSLDVKRHIEALPMLQRAHAEHFIAQHPEYPHGDTALVIDATIYAEYMAVSWQHGDPTPHTGVS